MRFFKLLPKASTEVVKSSFQEILFFCFINLLAYLPMILMPNAANLQSVYLKMLGFLSLVLLGLVGAFLCIGDENKLSGLLGVSFFISCLVCCCYFSMLVPLFFFPRAISLYEPILNTIGYMAAASLILKALNYDIYAGIVRQSVLINFSVLAFLHFVPTTLSVYSVSLALASYLAGTAVYALTSKVVTELSRKISSTQSSEIGSIKPKELASELFQLGRNTVLRMVEEDEQVFSNKAGPAAHDLSAK